MSASRSGHSSVRPSGMCWYEMPASSYACRLCGESSSDSTRVNPLPASQISSSWRRTLRWLRANPPGRSEAARRSLMIQQSARGAARIVDAHDASTVVECPDDGGERRVVALVRFRLVEPVADVAQQRAEEALAGGADHDG